MPRGVKSKKKPRVGAGEAADLLSAVNNHQIDEQELLRMLNVEKTPCDHIKSPCRAMRKDNVACFCQLVPAETSFRKKGLWQKEQAILDTLGADPTEQKREVSTPSGLRNLGNTCYANAALQCLYSIPSLRNGIYTAEAHVAGHDIFRQLQSLFLQMQFGPRSSVDTEALAKTLGLDHSIQQDGQEFMKLLLTRVEQMLGKSGNPAFKTLVPKLFRGGLSYVTTCQRCNRDSATSRDVQDFYDLMPQVKGFASLTESLAALLHAESLTGDNQYRCEYCSQKVDALRHVRLRSLPPYLCLALQRFYFDPRTADKAKALDKFTFPLQLDFREVLETATAAAAEGDCLAPGAPAQEGVGAGGGPDVNEAGAHAAASSAAAAALEVPQYPTGEPLYELVAILIHKGSQASSGHYVAHIKDQTSRQWWRFDDEVAECIGPDPTAKFQSDHGTSAAAAGAAAATAAATAAGQEGGKKKGAPKKRTAIGDASDDPDYDNDQEVKALAHANDHGDDQVGKAGRGKKRAASSRGRGHAPKRAAGGGRGRGRQAAATPSGAGSDIEDEDEELARAKAASLQTAQQPGGGRGRWGHGRGQDAATSAAAAIQGADGGLDGPGHDEDEDIRRALAASMGDQRAAPEREAKHEAEIVAALAESARASQLSDGDEGPENWKPRGLTPVKLEPLGGPTGGEGEEAAAAEAHGNSTAAAGGTPEEAGRQTSPGQQHGIPFGATRHVELRFDLVPPGDNPPAQQPAASAAMSGATATKVVSTNAYMLVYRAVGYREPAAVAEVAQLSSELQESVASQTAAFMESCDVHQRQRKALKEQVDARRRAVREVMAFIAPGSQPAREEPPQSQPQPQQELLQESPGASPQELPQNASQQPPQQAEQKPLAEAEKPSPSPAREAPADLDPRASPSSGPEGAASNGDGRHDAAGVQEGTDAPHVAPGNEGGADAGHGDSSLGYWLPTAWLEKWANDEGEPPPIDNGTIVCTRHGGLGDAGSAGLGGAGNSANGTVSTDDGGGGRPASAEGGALEGSNGGQRAAAALDPKKVTAAKLVSPAAWKRLQAAHGGGPCLAAGDVCRECLAKNFNDTLLGSEAAVMRAQVAALLAQEEAQDSYDAGDAAGVSEDEPGPGPSSRAAADRFWVSRTWLQGWSRRQGTSVKAEKSPTADLVCPHGQLLCARFVKTARRFAVPVNIWVFLRDLWRQQQVREAEEEATAGAKPGRRGRSSRRGDGAPAAICAAAGAVDCMDLTEDEPRTRRGAARPSAGPSTRCAAFAEEADDDVVEVVEVAVAGSARPGGMAEDGVEIIEEPQDAPEPTGAAAPGQAARPAIPTQEELDALCPALQVGRVRECAACRTVAGQAAEVQADTKRQVDLERAALGGLAAEVVPTVEPGGIYYLVPSGWVREWQQYVRVVPKRGTAGAAAGASAGPSGSAAAAGARGTTAGGSGAAVGNPRPGPLNESMIRVLCPCHPDELRLGVPLPRLVHKRTKFCQQTYDQDALRIISHEDWLTLQTLYGDQSTLPAPAANATAGGRRTRGGPAAATRRTAAAANRARAHVVEGDDDVMEVDNPKSAPAGSASGENGVTSLRDVVMSHGFRAQVVPSVGSPPIGVDQNGAAVADDGGDGPQALQGPQLRDRGPAAALDVWPPVCAKALAAHERAAKEALLSYGDAQVFVEQAQLEELEGAFREGAREGERKSKRSRKGRIALTIANTTRLEQLKLQIFESFSINPRNQSLYVQGADGQPRELQGDDLSLAQHEVVPEQEIRLVRLSVVDDDADVTDLLGNGRSKKRQVEEGFKNTALHGELPVQRQGSNPGDGAAQEGSSAEALLPETASVELMDGTQ